MNADLTHVYVTLVGILNVTPDSFADGGKNLSADHALCSARRMIREGAHIIDIGAESTRPGHVAIDVEEERARLAPVISGLAALGVPVSIDTTKAEIAAFALDQGAAIINDIWGLQGDAGMAPLAAARGAKVIVMHNRKNTDETIDIIDDINTFFKTSIEIAAAAGLPRDRLILDPGIGFGKTQQQNLLALKNLGALKQHGLPLLVGASRKSFIGKIHDSTPQERLPGTLAAHLAAVREGASYLRVHDVTETAQALRVQESILHA